MDMLEDLTMDNTRQHLRIHLLNHGHSLAINHHYHIIVYHFPGHGHFDLDTPDTEPLIMTGHLLD